MSASKSLKCRAIGCCLNDHTPECEHCGAYLYDTDFVLEGWITPLIRLRDRIIGLCRQFTRRCDVCGRRMWFTRLHDACCSEACYDKWIPF